MSRLLIVSNRLPVTVSAGSGALVVSRSFGGLATGLAGPHERSGGLWIGWPGPTDGLSTADRAALDEQLRALRAVPVYLSAPEVEGFYASTSNGVLLPLFHYLTDRVLYDQGEWPTYVAANERFAEAVCRAHRPGDLIWVHDYQLALVPAMVRRRIPDARIGFFLHIPFPAAEVFRLLPWREQLLEGLLGADLLGFHTFSYMRQFIDALTHTLGLMPSADAVEWQGRSVRFWAYPMGVDAAAFGELAADPALLEEAAVLRRNHEAGPLLLAVDRLDYTKGIPRRLLAIDRLLELRPELRGSLRFVQIAVPSRLDVPQYESFTGEVQQLVGRINGRWSTPSNVPVYFLHQGFSQRELVAFYRAADLMLVTPLRDGMNLVAKEFVASRPDEDGMLLLSEFAGAASEMGEAVLVNPYDIGGTAATMARTLDMPADERKTRMRALRERVLGFDVHRWASGFIADLESMSGASPKRAGPADVTPAALMETLSGAQQVVWLLDYDGTLVPYAGRAELAHPDPELLRLLRELAAAAGVEVHVVSGRSRDVLSEWLGGLGLGLHAEHGLCSWHDDGVWLPNLEVETGWKEAVRPLFRTFAARTPGALVEEKPAALAWHYRMADAEYGEWQARELKLHLARVLTNAPVEVLTGDKVVEVKPHGAHKGVVVPGLLQRRPGALFVAVGDDESDEQLFRSLPEGALAVAVGRRASPAATHHLPDVGAVRDLLAAFASGRGG